MAHAAAAVLLFHTPQSVETRNSQKLPREKTNFRSWRKQDKLQIVSFKFNLDIRVMLFFSSVMNYRVYSQISIGYFWSRPPSGNFRGLHFGGFPGTYGHVDTGFEQISASRVWGNWQLSFFVIFFGRKTRSECSEFENAAPLCLFQATVQARKWGVPNVVKILAKMEKTENFLAKISWHTNRGNVEGNNWEFSKPLFVSQFSAGTGTDD